MIVDRILDRKDGEPYNEKDFYNYYMKEASVFGYYIGGEIMRAMDGRKKCGRSGGALQVHSGAGL